MFAQTVADKTSNNNNMVPSITTFHLLWLVWSRITIYIIQTFCGVVASDYCMPRPLYIICGCEQKIGQNVYFERVQ